MITVVGGSDGLIMPRGVINYYRTMADRYTERSGRDPFIDARFGEGPDHHASERYRGVPCELLVADSGYWDGINFGMD
jgi:hypothetical protein